MQGQVPDPAFLAQCLLAQQHPASLTWATPSARLAEFAREAVDDVSMVTDLDFAAWRCDQFAPEHPAEVMLNRWVRVSDDLQAMLSMRYEGGDPLLPFVEVTMLTLGVESTRDLDALAAAAHAAYGVLAPRYVRLWSSHHANHFPGTLPDKRFLAAPLSTLRLTSLPTGLTAHPTIDLTHYDQACLAYQAVDAMHPHHPGQSTIETRASLDDTRRRGSLFDVLIDGTWSGYIAAKPGGRLGLPGFTIQELVLIESARGRSLGRYLSPLLAQMLPASDGVLVGTIHHDNTGALRAALDAGRIDIGGWFAIPIG